VVNKHQQRTEQLRDDFIVWLYDLDDTLMWTSYAYSVAFREFYDYMLKLFRYRLIELRTLGTISENIDLDLRDKINPVTGEVYGYSRYRFPQSLVKTYEWLCEQDFGKYNELVADRVREIGNRAFDPLLYQEQGLIASAEDVLDFHVEKRDKLYLVTKGDELVQQTKIDILELDRWFVPENMLIVPDKDHACFESFKELFPEHTLVSVGNSYRSDIKPAQEAGIRSLYIPYHTWAAEAEPENANLESVVVARRIHEVINEVNKGTFN